MGKDKYCRLRTVGYRRSVWATLEIVSLVPSMTSPAARGSHHAPHGALNSRLVRIEIGLGFATTPVSPSSSSVRPCTASL